MASFLNTGAKVRISEHNTKGKRKFFFLTLHLLLFEAYFSHLLLLSFVVTIVFLTFAPKL